MKKEEILKMTELDFEKAISLLPEGLKNEEYVTFKIIEDVLNLSKGIVFYSYNKNRELFNNLVVKVLSPKISKYNEVFVFNEKARVIITLLLEEKSPVAKEFGEKVKAIMNAPLLDFDVRNITIAEVNCDESNLVLSIDQKVDFINENLKIFKAYGLDENKAKIAIQKCLMNNKILEIDNIILKELEALVNN